MDLLSFLAEQSSEMFSPAPDFEADNRPPSSMANDNLKNGAARFLNGSSSSSTNPSADRTLWSSSASRSIPPPTTSTVGVARTLWSRGGVRGSVLSPFWPPGPSDAAGRSPRHISPRTLAWPVGVDPCADPCHPDMSGMLSHDPIPPGIVSSFPDPSRTWDWGGLCRAYASAPLCFRLAHLLPRRGGATSSSHTRELLRS